MMRNLRNIRILVSALFCCSAVAYAVIGLTSHRIFSLVPKTQIVPSMLAVTIGATAFWIVVTVLFGRLYCSAICPIGSITDGVVALKRKWMRHRGRQVVYRHRKEQPLVRINVMVVYLVCLVLGITVVPLLVEPWNMFSNIASVFNGNFGRVAWTNLGIGAAWGVVAGAFSLALVVLLALWRGREFCNLICPLGTIMGATRNRSLYVVTIDPDKCISCLKCEDVCSSGCINVAERHVDNSRCVRCFDCLEVCPNEAIRFQSSRPRAATPLMMTNH